MIKQILDFYSELSISNKLKFMGLSSALLASIIIFILFFTFQYIKERELTSKESTVFANILAQNIVSSIIQKDSLAVSNTLASVEYNDKIQQTFALNKSWKILGAFHKGNNFSKQRKIISTIKRNQNLWKGEYFYSVVPIIKDNTQYGYLVVVSSLEEFYRGMLKSSIVILLIILLAILITGRLRKVLQESILKPIAKLDNITTEIIETKNLNIDIPEFNSDEIGDLANNFKHMIGELDIYHNELSQQQETLTHQANHDSLTQLPNRMLFYDRLKQSIYAAKRYKGKFALFFIDLDQFKEVNDTFGHDYGDHLLQKIAKRLKSLLRENDTLARLGGDEFTIIMNNLNEYHSASILAQKILDILQIPVEVDEEELFISCSIGISLYPQDSQDPKELLKHADIAMYRSKDEGRNRYSFYIHEMTQEVLKRVNMQAQLRKALEEREFIVYYQPQYNMYTDGIVGVEALVRWNNLDKLIQPDEFITYAEEFGMIVGINRQVMKIAMLQAKKWHDKGLYFGRVSINVSVEQLEDENFVVFIKKLLQQTGCEASWIALELTENQVMKNTEIVITTLNELSKLNIDLAIDDFGTGYSSLAYLKHLPINKLKIDRTFISEIPSNEDDKAIVDTIIAISKSLNLGIIAEGVETLEQKEFLLSRGCRRVQGYLYSRPIPADKMTLKLVQV